MRGDGSEQVLITVHWTTGAENTWGDVFLLGFQDGLPILMFEERLVDSLSTTVQGTEVLVESGIYSENDAVCCPSGAAIRRLSWDPKQGRVGVSDEGVSHRTR